MYGLDDVKLAKGMHIAHINIRSITNKWDVFKAQFSSSNLHILGLSETWLNNKLPSGLYNLSNDYTFLRNDRNWCDIGTNIPKKGGGVALFIKNGLTFSEADYSHLNTNNIDIESQWVLVKQPNSKTILIGNIYRPPQGNIENFIQVLENSFTNIDLSKTELYLMGDFNIDMLDKKNCFTKKLLDFIKPFGLHQLIKSPTRYSKDKNSLLDNIFTNSDIISNSGVSDVNLSDHQLIIATRKKAKIIKKKCSFTGTSYRNYNKIVFQDDVTNADWLPFDNESTVAGKWKEMLNIIYNCINAMCPVKTFRVKQEKEQWITPPLLELIKDKDNAMRRAKRRNSPELWKIAKRLRNNCTKRLREARADFIKENLDNNVGNSKKIWKNIQEVIPNSNSKNKNSFDLFDKEKNTMVDHSDTANYINEFFTGIGPKLAQQYNKPWNYNGIETDIILEDIHTDIIEILSLCKDINVNKSSSINNLSSEIIRDAFMVVPMKVVELFNLSFDLCEVPDEWKIAKVTPLPKSGNSKDVSNLRPVSILPLPSKLIEKIVHNRVYNHCNDNKLLDEKQGGFRPNHSTISTTSFFLNDLYTAMNNNEATIAVYIDAMKAFDTVNHNILLQKLQYFGIRGRCAKWLKHYLSNRKQCTVANGIISDLKPITCGVPQGSVCGPLLFLLYINDITKNMKKCKVSLYADDTVLYYSSNNLDLATTTVQNDLIELSNWCNTNKLTINCKKTKYCIYGMRSIVKKSKNVDMILSLNNVILERVCSYKYLGFVLDDQLNFNKHIDVMINTISHKLYLLSRIRRYLSKQACILVFKTMVLSIIEYGDIIYSGTSKLNLDKIDKLFYRGLRICDASNSALSKNQLCKECDIVPLDKRRDVHLLLFMHKQSQKTELLKKRRARTRLHTAPVFMTYKPNHEKARQNVLYRGANAWNVLPSSDRNCDFNDFKCKIKKNRLK